MEQDQCRSGADLPIADRQAADLDQVNLRRGLLITHDPQYRANPNPYPVSSGAKTLGRKPGPIVTRASCDDPLNRDGGTCTRSVGRVHGTRPNLRIIARRRADGD